VVTEINGKPVLSASELRNHNGLTQGGTNVTITYLRSGKQYKVTVSIAPTAIIIRRDHEH
jgi:S1-C subfamily serine protease